MASQLTLLFGGGRIFAARNRCHIAKIQWATTISRASVSGFVIEYPFRRLPIFSTITVSTETAQSPLAHRVMYGVTKKIDAVMAGCAGRKVRVLRNRRARKWSDDGRRDFGEHVSQRFQADAPTLTYIPHRECRTCLRPGTTRYSPNRLADG